MDIRIPTGPITQNTASLLESLLVDFQRRLESVAHAPLFDPNGGLFVTDELQVPDFQVQITANNGNALYSWIEVVQVQLGSSSGITWAQLVGGRSGTAAMEANLSTSVPIGAIVRLKLQNAPTYAGVSTYGWMYVFDMPSSSSAQPNNWVSTVYTTIADSISSGTRTVTPASMDGILLNSNLYIDTGSLQELVAVTTVTATTFTADFASSHGTDSGVSGAPTELSGTAGNVWPGAIYEYDSSGDLVYQANTWLQETNGFPIAPDIYYEATACDGLTSDNNTLYAIVYTFQEFPVQLTAVTDSSGEYLYTFEEQTINSYGYQPLTAGRYGTPTGAIRMVETNNWSLTGVLPLYAIAHFKGYNGDDYVYEFTSNVPNQAGTCPTGFQQVTIGFDSSTCDLTGTTTFCVPNNGV